jgi:hypothetical protein
LNTPDDQAKQHTEQARDKLAGVEREAGEIAEAYSDGLPQEVAVNLAARWQNTIGAAQAHATLAVAERLAAVVGLLEVLTAPPEPTVNVIDTIGPSWLSDPGYAEAEAGRVALFQVDAKVEWRWWDATPDGSGEWVGAAGEREADTLAGPGGRVRSRVVGPWIERSARWSPE